MARKISFDLPTEGLQAQPDSAVQRTASKDSPVTGSRSANQGVQRPRGDLPVVGRHLGQGETGRGD